MKKLIKAVVVGGGLLGMAYATSGPHFYIKGLIGVGGMDTPGTTTSYLNVAANLLSFTRREERGFMFGVSGGAMFDVSQQFSAGAELGYEYWQDNQYSIYNSSAANTTDFKYSGYPINFLAVGSYHFNKLLSVDLKAGIAYQHQKLVKSNASSGTYNSSKVLPKVGGGLTYSFANNIFVSAEYLHAFGKKISPSNINNVVSSNTATFGVGYRFG